jgi:xylose isomerase
MRQAIITAFLGQLRDRFCNYQEPLTTQQKLERVGLIPGAEGVEIVFPYEADDAATLKEMISGAGLSLAAINVNVKGDPDFLCGSLTSPDHAVRSKAVRYIKSAKDFAKATNATRVTCCPLSDGYDYALHTHYVRAWERMVDCVREAALYLPEIELDMEYKPSETRVHCTLDSAAKAILLCNAVGHSNIGVTLDVGHSIYGGESPAEALSHIHMSGLPVYVHINDNNGRWDWDLVAGSCNLWQYIEFLFYLKEFGYDGWLTTDASPVRQDTHEFFSFNIRFTNRIWDWLDTIDREMVHALLVNHKYLEIMKLMEASIFRPELVVR